MPAPEVILDVRYEFYKERTQAALRCNHECAFDSEFQTSIGGGIVQVRDAASDKVAKNIRVVRLPLSVIALASHGGSNRVPHSFDDAACAHAKVTRVLMEESRKDGISDDGAVEAVSVSGAIAFRIAFEALAILIKIIGGLAVASQETRRDELKRIHGTLECQVKLLSRSKRRSILAVVGVVIWDDSEKFLVLFGF